MSFDQAWLDQAVAASADRAPTGLHGSADLLIGKTVQLSIQVDDGCITGLSTGTADCQFPFTKTQVEAFVAGEMKLSVNYMRGDLKPPGSTAAILAVIDAMDSL